MTMDKLREMARAPLVILERFLGEVQRITGDKTIAAPATEDHVRNLQAAMARGIETSLQEFHGKAQEVEAGLMEILRPPHLNIYEEIKRVVQQLQHLQEVAARRDRLLRVWDDQPADAITEGYRAALERHDLETVELYEAEAERALRRKGNAAALQTFLSTRAQAAGGRLSPAQQQAKANLEEIERLRCQVTVATRVVASALQSTGSIAAGGPAWRKGSRLRVEAQAGLRVLILPGPRPMLTASVVDVSREGLGLALLETLSSGALLDLVVEHAPRAGGELRVQGEVRWCRVDARTPSSFVAGVRLVSDGGAPWVALLHRLAQTHRDGHPVPDACQPMSFGGGPRP